MEHTSGSLIDYLWLERFLKDMHSSYKDTFQHTFLKPIKNSFVCVCVCVCVCVPSLRHCEEKVDKNRRERDREKDKERGKEEGREGGRGEREREKNSFVCVSVCQ